MGVRNRSLNIAGGAAAVTGLLLGSALGAAPGASTSPTPADVLSRRCLSCHSAEKKVGGVDLSTAAGARAVGANAPDDPAKNRLVRAVVTGKMPPAGRLPAAEITALREWVRTGATYPTEPLHAMKVSDQPLWSLEPVKRPSVPKTPFDRLARNPIDRFLFEKLAEKGLRPSPPASRLALIRRVTLDLTGLPPTPEEVTAFLADKNPDAYEKVVDRLLASPAYGERWARQWLDVVRFGESNGYEQNHLRANAWPYRDWVIRSLNADKPYDRFVQEQLAGDVLGKGDPDVEAGTGFLVAGIHDTVGNQTEEGTRQQRANDLDDIVGTTSETFLGLTAGCAKCHDHKFDPIPQRDFYRLAAVFSGVRHGERPLIRPEASERADSLTQSLRLATGRLADLDLEARSEALRRRGVQPVPRPAVSVTRNVDDFAPIRARFVRFTITATKDGSQPCLDELEVYGPDHARNLALATNGAKATASSLLPGYAIHQVAHLNDGRYGNEWSWISNEPGAGWAQIELPAEAEVARVVWSRDGNPTPRFSDRIASGYRVELSLDGREWRTVSTEAGRATQPDKLSPAELDAARTPAQLQERKELQARIDTLQSQLAQVRGLDAAYVGQFTAPDPVYVLKRGDVMQRGDEAAPGALSRIPGFPGDLAPSGPMSDPQRRLALAKWLTDPRNPLTTRVIVNRVWQGHFGRGIVGTPSDFGHNGEAPTHPELLDWLASDFVEGVGRWALGVGGAAPKAQGLTPSAHPWSLKRLHRLIVTSYAYCQSAAADPKGMAVDAADQYLWRMPLRRMDAEMLRDAILTGSGKLDRHMGGPGYRLYKYRVVNVAIYEPLDDPGPETWRRGVYAQAARGIRDDLLGAFDCPESAQRTPRRPATTTALQALSLLNGPFMVGQSGLMADRLRAEAPANVDQQIDRAFRLVYGRAPRPDERSLSRELIHADGLPAFCRGLLNTNEFLYY